MHADQDQQWDMPSPGGIVRRLELDAVLRLGGPEKADARLKKIVADQAVGMRVIKEVAKREF
jgi:hypothetical protein